MKKQRKIIVAITGASGSLYARILVGKLTQAEGVRVSVIVSDNGLSVIRYEDSADWLKRTDADYFDNRDFFTPPASGSADYEAMVVIPCSMGTLGRIAAGISTDLIGRAADVMLKERRKLILATRETPISTIHLRNMLTLSESGAVIAPLSPAFYSHPENIEGACMTVVDRILSLLDISHNGYQWDPEPRR